MRIQLFFKFLSDGPENLGRVFLLFQNIAVLYTLSGIPFHPPTIFSADNFFSTHISPSLETCPSGMLEDSELCIWDSFGSGHGRLYQGGKYGIIATPCGLYLKSLEFRISELISGQCLNVEGMEDR